MSRVGLGTIPQESGLPSMLKVGEVVDFIAGHYPDPMPRAEVLERFGIGDIAARQTGDSPTHQASARPTNPRRVRGWVERRRRRGPRTGGP